MFDGKDVRLRSLEPEDAVSIHQWCNDLKVIRWLGDRYPVSLPEARRIVEREMVGNFSNFLAAVETTADGKLIGTGRLKGADPESRDAEIDLWIGDQNYWRKGFGSEAMAMLCRVGFDTMGLHRVTGYAYAENHSSIHVCKKIGFSVEGTLRRARWKNGDWRDLVVLGMLADELIRS